jgi:hypothetical protein
MGEKLTASRRGASLWCILFKHGVGRNPEKLSSEEPEERRRRSKGMVGDYGLWRVFGADFACVGIASCNETENGNSRHFKSPFLLANLTFFSTKRWN